VVRLAYNGAMQDFEWLPHKTGRRAQLRDCERAIRKGWLAGSDPAVVAKRRSLLAAMWAVQDEPGLTAKEEMRICLMVAAMAQADMATAEADLKLASDDFHQMKNNS
jgi:hypothetical protein